MLFPLGLAGGQQATNVMRVLQSFTPRFQQPELCQDQCRVLFPFSSCIPFRCASPPAPRGSMVQSFQTGSLGSVKQVRGARRRSLPRVQSRVLLKTGASRDDSAPFRRTSFVTISACFSRGINLCIYVTKKCKYTKCGVFLTCTEINAYVSVTLLVCWNTKFELNSFIILSKNILNIFIPNVNMLWSCHSSPKATSKQYGYFFFNLPLCARKQGDVFFYKIW